MKHEQFSESHNIFDAGPDLGAFLLVILGSSTFAEDDQWHVRYWNSRYFKGEFARRPNRMGQQQLFNHGRVNGSDDGVQRLSMRVIRLG